jgi:hypothetical protein
MQPTCFDLTKVRDELGGPLPTRADDGIEPSK